MKTTKLGSIILHIYCNSDSFIIMISPLTWLCPLMSRVNVESREAEVVKEGEYSADDLKSDVSTSTWPSGHIAIWMSKMGKNLIFFLLKYCFVFLNNNFWQFFLNKCQIFAHFLTFKWQFPGGSDLHLFRWATNSTRLALNVIKLIDIQPKVYWTTEHLIL